MSTLGETIMATNAEDIKQQAENYEKLILKQIGVFINTKRKEKGITVRDLNKMTGVSLGVISDLENTNCMPRVETLLRICEALDIHMNVLFENMKLTHKATRKGANVSIDKYDKLGQILAGLEDFTYTKEDVAEIVSYMKYLDFKKQSK
jgi:transcriptional regulator with XRE-family HTH domain